MIYSDLHDFNMYITKWLEHELLRRPLPGSRGTIHSGRVLPGSIPSKRWDRCAATTATTNYCNWSARFILGGGSTKLGGIITLISMQRQWNHWAWPAKPILTTFRRQQQQSTDLIQKCQGYAWFNLVPSAKKAVTLAQWYAPGHSLLGYLVSRWECFSLDFKRRLCEPTDRAWSLSHQAIEATLHSKRCDGCHR